MEMKMPVANATVDPIVRRGQEIYEHDIRSKVEEGNKGKLLVINVNTGEYEMDADDLVAAKRAKVRFGDAELFTMRIGYPAAYRIGGHLLARKP